MSGDFGVRQPSGALAGAERRGGKSAPKQSRPSPPRLRRLPESARGLAQPKDAPDHPAAKYVGLKKWGWYLDDLERWASLFGTEERVRALEIGAFDGISANVMLDVLFPHPESRVHCIDPYLPDPTTPRVNAETKVQFEANARSGEHEGRIVLHVGLSAEVLAWMVANEGFWESFDFVYVDGSHEARNVFMDAAGAWNLLKVGGVMVFDDYEWGQSGNPYGRPKPAIDAFQTVFGDRLELVLGGYRRGFRKLAA